MAVKKIKILCREELRIMPHDGPPLALRSLVCIRGLERTFLITWKNSSSENHGHPLVPGRQREPDLVSVIDGLEAGGTDSMGAERTVSCAVL